jgi:hypothetical protein
MAAYSHIDGGVEAREVANPALLLFCRLPPIRSHLKQVFGVLATDEVQSFEHPFLNFWPRRSVRVTGLDRPTHSAAAKLSGLVEHRPVIQHGLSGAKKRNSEGRGIKTEVMKGKNCHL